MAQGSRGLGRGLSALLPQDRPHGGGGPELREIGLDDIKPNPHQPRQPVDESSLAELAASIGAVGLLQPVIVRQSDGAYELVAGERRWRAARLAGLERIPAIVRETGDDDLLREALIENVQRVDLNPLEEAAAYRQLIDDLGLTHEEVADRVGKSRAAVTNSLRLMNLAADVQQRIASGLITAAHGRAIAALADHGAQARAAARVVAEGLNVRQTEDLIRQMAGSGEAVLTERAQETRERRPRTRAERPAAILEAEQILADHLQTRVMVEEGKKRGRIVVEYADLDDLDRIMRVILGE